MQCVPHSTQQMSVIISPDPSQGSSSRAHQMLHSRPPELSCACDLTSLMTTKALCPARPLSRGQSSWARPPECPPGVPNPAQGSGWFATLCVMWVCHLGLGFSTYNMRRL